MKKILLLIIIALSINANAQTAYIPINGDSLAVINVPTNIVTATIPFSSLSGYICVSQDGTRVYVTESVHDSVYVINTSTNTIVARIYNGPNPGGNIALSPDGSKLYVHNTYYNSIDVINTATNVNYASIPMPCSGNMVVSPDGAKLYVVNYYGCSPNLGVVSVINTSTNTVTDTIGVGLGPSNIAVSPDGSKIYVTNFNSFTGNTVSSINTATDSVTATITVGTAPIGVSISPDGSKVYVCNNHSNTVSVINTLTDTILTTVAVGLNPFGVSVSPNGSKVYVANYGSNSVSVINPVTNTVVDTFALSGTPNIIGNFISTYTPPCVAHHTTSYDSTLNSFTLTVDSITSASAVSYHWSFGDGTTSTLVYPTHTYPLDTTYNVCLKIYTATGDSCEYCHSIGKDYLGHIYRTAGFTLNVHNPSAGINEINNKETEITISPNPFTSQTTITFSEAQKNTTIKITDVLGNIIRNYELGMKNEKSITIDMSGASKGIYFVQITDASKNVLNKKIVVQ